MRSAHPKTALRTAALLAVSLAATACGAPDRQPGVATSRPPNLVLVVVDALRADHVGAYGGPRGLTPQLDRFAAEATVFEQARTLAPCTFPSVNGLLTGQHPARFLDQPLGHLGIPPQVATLPAALRRSGYRTAAVSASPVVRASPGAINRAGGFGHGFDLFLEGCTWQDGRCVTRRAADLLALLPEPFFLYVHYLDPHDPYASPHASAAAAGTGGDAPNGDLPPWVLAGDPLPAARRLYGGTGGEGATVRLAREPAAETSMAGARAAGGQAPGDRTPGLAPDGPAPGALARAGLSAPGLAHLRRRYADEVAFADAEVGRLLALLDDAGLAARSAVVVTADHGESFLEHGHLRHCRSLYEEEVRVPLMLRLPEGAPRAAARGPNGPAGSAGRIAAPVTLLDLAPTLLALAGAPPQWLPRAEGRGLLEVLSAPAAPRRPPVAVAGTWSAVLAGRHKLLRDAAAGEVRLYDLAADPGERYDLSASHPHLTTRLRRHLAPQPPAAATHLERLQALGYLR